MARFAQASGSRARTRKARDAPRDAAAEEAALNNEKDEASQQRLETLRKELAELRSQADAQLDVTPAARELIAHEGYDPVYGARPLRRYIQREVEIRIGRALLAGDIADGSTITLDAHGGAVEVGWAQASESPQRIRAAA